MEHDPAGRLVFGRPIRPSHWETRMRRHSCAFGLLAALFLLPGSGRAADTPYAGIWKVIFAPGANEMTWFIIKVENKDSGAKVELVATHTDYKEFKLQADKSAGGVLRITADGPGGPFKFTIYPPKGDKEPQKMLGSVGFLGLRGFVRLERTDDKAIDSSQRFKSAPGEPNLTKSLCEKSRNPLKNSRKPEFSHRF